MGKREREKRIEYPYLLLVGVFITRETNSNLSFLLNQLMPKRGSKQPVRLIVNQNERKMVDSVSSQPEEEIDRAG